MHIPILMWTKANHLVHWSDRNGSKDAISQNPCCPMVQLFGCLPGLGYKMHHQKRARDATRPIRGLPAAVMGAALHRSLLQHLYVKLDTEGNIWESRL